MFNNRKFQWASVIFSNLLPPKILCYWKFETFRNFSVKCKPEMQSADCTPRNNHLTLASLFLQRYSGKRLTLIIQVHPSWGRKSLFNSFPKNNELNRSRSLPVLELVSVRRSFKNSQKIKICIGSCQLAKSSSRELEFRRISKKWSWAIVSFNKIVPIIQLERMDQVNTDNV